MFNWADIVSNVVCIYKDFLIDCKNKVNYQSFMNSCIFWIINIIIDYLKHSVIKTF